MSRRAAHDSIPIEEFEQVMNDVYSESVTEAVKDEASMAYKLADAIIETLEPTAEVTATLEVVHNLKTTE